MTQPRNVSLIGLGVMGGPIARHIARAGHSLTVYNRSAPRLLKWQGAHPDIAHRVATSPADAAQGADMVITCVGNDDDLADVVVPRHVFVAPRTGITTRWAGLWHAATHRLRESDEGFLYRLSGELFAMRRELFPAEVGAPIIDDAAIGSLLQQGGARFRYEPDACTEIVPPLLLRDWFRQKLRTRRGMVQLRRSEPTVWRYQRKLVSLVLRGKGSLPLRVSLAVQEVSVWGAAWLAERVAGPIGGSWTPITSTKRWSSGAG